MIEIRLLGEFSLTFDDEPIELRSSRLQSLLTYLIIHRSAPQRRDQVAFALWPDTSETSARRNLRQLLYRLRKALPHTERLIQITRQTLRWSPDEPAAVDVVAFRQACETATSIGDLQSAVDYYRGNLLPACYDEWLLQEREQLRLVYLRTLETLIAQLEGAERYEEAIPYARKLLADEPLREGTYRRLMRLYAVSGDRAGALRVYRECTRVLQAELDIEPSEATQRVYDDLTRYAPAQETAHNLPAQPTPFVGRSQELVELAEMLDDPDCRLVTITGPGGIGKTRLALQAGREHLDAFPDGVFFVSLAAIETTDALVPAIAEAIDLSIRGTVDIRQRLASYLSNKRILLILDNVEHLITEASTKLLVDLIESTDHLKILVTSRERLRLRWEWCFALNGLRLPDERAVALQDSSAARLFQQVARRMDHRFALTGETAPAVADVCQLVAGMPLAIELAASLVNEYSCSDIARRLTDASGVLRSEMRDMPARHRSVRATIDYSWSRLSSDLQARCRRLSVFRGGFMPQAAEYIAGASQDVLSIFDDRSFLNRDGSERYTQHPLLRQFAAEQLAQHEDECQKIHRTHCEFYIKFLVARDGALNSEGHREALRELRREIENIRAGWLWAVRQQEYELINRAVAPLHNFYWYSSRLQEGLDLFEQTLAHLRREAIPDGVLLKVHARRATLLYRVGQYEHASQLLRACIPRLRRLNARSELAFALSRCAYVQQILGDYGEARDLAREALALHRELGNRSGVASTLNDCGVIAMKQGAFDEARTLLHESLALRRAGGNPYSTAVTLCNLGVIAGQQEEFDEARRIFEQSLHLYEHLSDQNGISYVLNNLAVVARKTGAYAEARQLLERSLGIKRTLGDRWSVAGSLNNLGSIAVAQGDLQQARAHYREVVQMSSEARAIPAVLYALAGLASVMQQEGRREPALALTTFVLDHRARNGETEALARAVREGAAQSLAPDTVASIEDRAASMSMDAAIQLALQ